MVHLIYGLPGTGKTTLLTQKIREDAEKHRKAILIVPEQQTVEVERTMTHLLPPSSQLTFEVVNFTRLANKLFRIYGGLSYHYITPGLKELFMWQTLRTLSPFLVEYNGKATSDTSLSATMLGTIGELKNCNISPVRLEKATADLPNDKALTRKLKDLSLIYSTYDGMVRESFDDSSDDLAKLSEILEKHNFFHGYRVYVDSFTDYTAQEYRILKCMIAQADEVTLTLLSGGPDCHDIFLSGVNDTSLHLRHLAAGKERITILNQFHRFASPELTRIASELWHFDTMGNENEITEENRGAVSLIRCSGAYGEAEAVASKILSLVQDGYRYREIAVIARNADDYRGILEPALEKSKIPFFMSEKTDLTTKPLVCMIFSALAIKIYHYRRQDVITYIKTGLCGFSPYEIDIFETYTATWRIRGSQFTNGTWEMNPDGYSETISARGKKILETAETVRKKLVASLEEFFLELDSAKTVSTYCNAIYRFLKKQNITETLKEYVSRALADGEKKEAAETAGIFKAIFGILGDMVSTMGDEEMELEEFVTALRIVLGKTEIGTIPTAADEVMIGSASMLRTTNIRCAILIGVCEGEFPMRVRDKGLFSDNDRMTLSDIGISLSGTTTQDAQNELLYIYRAMTMPSQKLILIYRDKQIGNGTAAPSIAFRRVSELLPYLKVQTFEGLSPYERIFDKENAFEALPSLKNDAAFPSLYRLLESDPNFAIRLPMLSRSVTEARCRLEKGTASALFGNSLSLTQSQIEKYVSCHFSYYCRYVLKLRETKKASFDYSNIGVFIHRILEIFLKTTGKDTIDADHDLDKIKQIIHDEIAKQSIKVIPLGRESEGRMVHLLLRFYRLATLVAVNICRERKDSLFLSRLYEAEFGENSNCGAEAPSLLLKDGSRVTFGGKVDRIDTYRSDGKVYVRVVDYKTGAKSFSLDDIRKGYSIQLLLYLFAVCDNRSDQFRKLLGCEKNDVLTPAGAVYLSMAVPNLSRKVGDTDEMTLKNASDNIKRSGILCHDETALRAMSQSLDPKILAGIKISSRDGCFKGDALTEPDTFLLLHKELNDTICRIALEIKSGNADACPDTHGGVLACTYCEMKPFCRVDKLKASEKFKDEEKMP